MYISLKLGKLIWHNVTMVANNYYTSPIPLHAPIANNMEWTRHFMP